MGNSLDGIRSNGSASRKSRTPGISLPGRNPPEAARPAAGTLSGWLADANRRSFVGRAEEVELFLRWLLDEELPLGVLHVYGPGGVGKTTLLREYARIALNAGLPVFQVDGRAVQPSPQGFFQALEQAGWEASRGGLLLLDTYEMLAPLDSWLRESFLPALPQPYRVAIAGRLLPAPEWRTDLVWRELTRIVPLRNLRPEESHALLAALNVPEANHDAILACTYGHPLALVLMADWLALREHAEPLALERAPDAVRLLVERFVRDVPGPRHRQALEVSAHARVTTEALLAEVLGADDSYELFAWLRGLSFMEHGPEGLFPHDLVRDVLEADLRWRNPDGFRRVHRQVRGYAVRRFEESTGLEQQLAFGDLLYMHRHQPLMKPFYEWKAFGTVYVEPATPQDHEQILEMVRRHEGPESGRIAAYWLRRQPQAFLAFRSADPLPIGFIANLRLEDPNPEDLEADPAIRAAWEYVHRYGPLRPGEFIFHHRFKMGREVYHNPLVQNLVAIACSQLWLTSANLAWAFPTEADPDAWEAMFAYLNFHRATEADFEVGGRRYGVFAHDWRAEPPRAWLERMGERELAVDLKPESLAAERPAPLLVLSEPEFAEAVRQALRDYTHPDALAGNPLLRSRLVQDRAGPNPRPEALQALLREAADALAVTPKSEKMTRALAITYFEPAPSQEAAAERLDLPFSTYRYHLRKGIDAVTAWLWQRELYGTEPDLPAGA